MGVVFFVLAAVAIHMAGQPNAITNVWFANAAAIAVLATAARSRWPALLAAVALANFAANVLLRGDVLLSVSFVPGNLVEVLIGAYLLHRHDLARGFDSSPKSFALAVMGGGMLPQLAGATLGAATLQAYGFATFEAAWLDWYVRSTLGALATLPLALALCNARLNGSPLQLFTPAALGFLLLTVATTWVAFVTLPAPFAVVALPLVASVFVLAPLATFGLCFVVVLVVCAGLDYRWFVAPGAGRQWSELFLYFPAAIAVLPAQLLAVVVPRMRQLQADTDALTLVGADTVAVFDRQGIFRGVNSAYERTFGRSREQLIGHSIEERVDPPHTALARERFERALQGQPVQVRVERDSAIGPRALDVRYQPVPDTDGHIRRVLLSAHDVTDLVAVQRDLEQSVARLRHANEGMQQFVRIASHDMREPLNTIAQFCALIEADHGTELAPSVRLYFEQVHTGAKRMRVLLDDVLSFARLDEGAELATREVGLSDIVEAVRLALGARIAQCQAQLDVAGPLPTVVGQESLLVLLVQNLVANGIKFSAPGRPPRLRISAREDAGQVVLTVADNGIGIAAEDQSQIFTPFKRLHTRRQYDGTGLGLAISQRIAHMLGGSIRLESQLGVGTQMHVRLRLPVGHTALS